MFEFFGKMYFVHGLMSCYPSLSSGNGHGWHVASMSASKRVFCKGKGTALFVGNKDGGRRATSVTAERSTQSMAQKNRLARRCVQTVILACFIPILFSKSREAHSLICLHVGSIRFRWRSQNGLSIRM